MGQAGAGGTGDRSKEGHAPGGQIRGESPSTAGTDPGGSPPRTAGNDTHKSAGSDARRERLADSQIEFILDQHALNERALSVPTTPRRPVSKRGRQ